MQRKEQALLAAQPQKTRVSPIPTPSGASLSSCRMVGLIAIPSFIVFSPPSPSPDVPVFLDKSSDI